MTILDEGRVRNLINDPRLQQTLLSKPGWYQICSSLDVLGDTSLAIEAYIKLDAEKGSGKLYLMIYGLFQALFLQQDALDNLCEPLGIDYDINNYPALKEIREIRNSSIGHPTKKDRPKSQPTTYNFISRHSLSHDGFALDSVEADGTRRHKFISVKKVIDEQKALLSGSIEAVAQELERADKEHRDRFKMDKLADRFPPTLDYFFEKLYEATRASAVELGPVALSYVEKAFSDFRTALESRGLNLETYAGIKHLYSEVAYPLEKLRAYFGKENFAIDSETAYIFVRFVQRELAELIKIAREVDEEYAS